MIVQIFAIAELVLVQWRPKLGPLTFQAWHLSDHGYVGRGLASTCGVAQLYQPCFTSRLRYRFNLNTGVFRKSRKNMLVKSVLEKAAIDTDLDGPFLGPYQRWHGKQRCSGNTGSKETASSRIEMGMIAHVCSPLPVELHAQQILSL